MSLAHVDGTVTSIILIGVAIMAAVAIHVMKQEAHEARKQRDDYDWDI